MINNSDISSIAGNISYTDPLNNGASSLKFEYPASKAGLFPNGSVVVFSYGGANVFYGFLIESQMNKSKVICTAYDQLFYLKMQDFMLRQGETLDAFAKKIFATVMTRISVGTIEPTGAVLSDKPFDGKTYLDMIYESIRETTYLNGCFYALRDEFGALTLREVMGLRLGLIIGDGSLATDFNYSVSIGSDTYNVIKAAQDNSEAGQRDVTMAQDSATIEKWGKLQRYQKFSGRNDAQMKALAASLLLLKNRETEKLSVNCIGDLRVRAGVGVKVQLSNAGVDLWAIVNNAVHSFDGAKHTMQLELTYGRWQSWT